MGNFSKSIFVVGLALALLQSSDAQVKKFRDCSIDFELIALPACAVENRNEQQYVLKEFVDYVFEQHVSGVGVYQSNVNGHDLVAVCMPESGWGYIDRTGRVVVNHVAEIDNGPSEFHSGLVRVAKDGKFGLSNDQGKLIAPMNYDQIFEFDPAHGWLACAGCKAVWVGEEGSIKKGGTWYWLNEKGQVAGKAKEPS